jgi:dTDP-glucose 4,6-dehydratase
MNRHITSAISQTFPFPIYRDGKNIQDWLYILDHCKGIDIVYYTGGRNERKICNILDKKVPRKSSYKNLITFVQGAGHDRRYAIDASKIENELGWRANEDFDSGIIKTIEWYLKKNGVFK